MQGIIEKYRKFLPLLDDKCIISLGEGDTPLLRLNNIENEIQSPVKIYAKFEGTNPTGSFKDRGMTLAVSNALAQKSPAVICASTGNTSASAAAYAAKAGLRAFVIIPEGKIAKGKLMQAYIHGAHVLQIQGNFDQGLAIVKQLAEQLKITLVNSLNPYRIPGQQTAAYEIVDVLKRAPDYHYLPIGNGGNTTAYWQGYETYRIAGKHSRSPIMVGCQAKEAAPFVLGHFVEQPETIATAIRIGKPAYWEQSNQAIKYSGGHFLACTDKVILAAQRLLAAKEGIFCEPASAAALAGLMVDLRHKKLSKGSVVVCTLTGHGLKDTQIIENTLDIQLQVVPAEYDVIAQQVCDIIGHPKSDQN